MMEFEDEEHDEEELEEDDDDEEETMAAALSTPSFRTTTSSDKKPPQPGGVARYRECLKNHAVAIGGHALDGCGEFMPAGPDGSLDALKCAACNCHRNFHRKELLLVENNNQLTVYNPRPHHIYHPPQPPPHATPPPHVYQFYPYNRTNAAAPTTPSFPHGTTTRPLALPSSTTAGGTNSSGGGGGDVEEQVTGGMMAMTMTMTSSSGKKRHRTKFTQEQKDKMLALAERLGWRIQKHDETAVQEFCDETGVKRHVLKVWMHNNKHTLGKKP